MTNNARKLVVVTGANKRFPIAYWAIRFMLWLNNIKTVYCAPGGRDCPSEYDGVVISGGDDIHPENYGDLPHQNSRYDIERDRLEMSILHQALEKDVPILGICRGAQLLNIAEHGSLYLDIRHKRHQTPNKYTPLPIKEVNVKPDSKLVDCVGEKKLTVNSLHNQAVKKIGEGMFVTARDADGFVQAIEHKSKFIVGVQWHPEYLPYMRSHRAIFRCFSDAVKRQNNHQKTS